MSAAALRTWTRDGRILAVGFLDGADLLEIHRDALVPGERHPDVRQEGPALFDEAGLRTLKLQRTP